MNDLKDRRTLKNYLIKREVQLKFICINFLYMFLITFVTIFVMLFPLISLMYETVDAEIQYQASKTFVVIFKDLPIAIGLVFLLFFIHQLIITHQLCGPMINFINTFKKIAMGDLTKKVHLRRYDFLREEKEHINEMIDALSHTVGNIKKDHNKLLSSLNEKDLETALKQAQLLSEHLSVFKLANPNKPSG
jgi:methyl-accepting chemotaxis protein